MKTRLLAVLRYALLAGIFGATLEVMARLDDRLTHGAPLFGRYDATSMLIDRDSLGIKGRAFGRFEKWTLNSKGFRGREFTVPKPKDRIRIVTLGASETFGLYESERQHWPAQLRKHIETRYPGRSIDLVNAAIVGLTVSSMEHYFRNRVEWIEPDLVILYPHFIDYIAGDGPGARKARSDDKPRKVPGGDAHESGPGPLRFPGKLKQAAKTKGPQPIMRWAARRLLERDLAAIDTSIQEDDYDAGELARFDSLMTSFCSYLGAKGIDLIVSDYAFAFARGSREETLEGLVNMWKHYPWLSRKALVEGLNVYNAHLAGIAARTRAILVSQASLFDGYRDNWVADGVHFTDQGAGLAARNFFPAVDAWLAAELAARGDSTGQGRPVVQKSGRPLQP